MIRELTVSEVEQVSGAGFFGDLWGCLRSWVERHLPKVPFPFPRSPFPRLPWQI